MQNQTTQADGNCVLDEAKQFSSNDVQTCLHDKESEALRDFYHKFITLKSNFEDSLRYQFVSFTCL